MSGSSWHKDRYGSNGELYQSNNGTSARTRPFSFEEIMLRRKRKNAAGEVHSVVIEADIGENIGDDIVEKAADGLQGNRDRHRRSTHGSSGRILEDSAKVSSRERQDNTSMNRERKFGKDRAKESQDDIESKSKLNDIESKSKLTPLKSLTHDNVRLGKSDRYTNHKKRSARPDEDSKDKSGERYSRDLIRKDLSTEKISRKSEKEKEFREGNDKNGRPINKKRNVDQLRHDYENESHKRHSRRYAGPERDGEGHRGHLEKERKKKHHVEEKEKTEDRNDLKKLDLLASKTSEFSERKEKVSSRVHYDESRLKSIRSRSRERENDKSGRPHSLSPKTSKYASKDRSQPSHTDVERKKISSKSSDGYRRHSVSSSGLGGYSPRKRKSEAPPKTSPSNRSPERRNAGWDFPSAGKDGNSSGPVISGLQSSREITSLNVQENSNVVPESSFAVKPVIMPQYTSSQVHAIDSIQLTQATRPMRRLYVENLPASASEKALMEYMNSFLLSSGVNRIHGTLPCISCMIHKEKGQALLEFLTPEDASAALSFDGRSFSGSIIKIRRPKDFIEVTTGVADKSMDTSNRISETVEDSSHKIFIGGISKRISSEMLVDIARAFGPLKAFHFEHNAEIDASCAFLEYIDHLVTLKACAGLNGLKLGGQVLTVVQALPDASSLGNANDQPFYGIPEHAKPLLEKPTEILKIKNVLDPEGISSLSEAELEEILEDIKLECSRFGTVKAVNVVKQGNYSSTGESLASVGVSGDAVNHKDNKEASDKTTAVELENLDESTPSNTNIGAGSDHKPGMPNPLINSTGPDDFNEAAVSNGDSDNEVLANMATDETCKSNIDDTDMSSKDAGSLENSRSGSGEHGGLPNSSKDHEIEDKLNIDKSSDLEEDNARQTSTSIPNPGETKDSDICERAEDNEMVENFANLFELGCVLVEFKRAETSCMAAHCLHGRLFDDRIVTVEYVSPHLHRKRFPK